MSEAAKQFQEQAIDVAVRHFDGEDVEPWVVSPVKNRDEYTVWRRDVAGLCTVTGQAIAARRKGAPSPRQQQWTPKRSWREEK